MADILAAAITLLGKRNHPEPIAWDGAVSLEMKGLMSVLGSSAKDRVPHLVNQQDLLDAIGLADGLDLAFLLGRAHALGLIRCEVISDLQCFRIEVIRPLYPTPDGGGL